jgi:hypothetical protein
LETGRSSISRSLDDLGETATAEPKDRKTPLVRYLENPASHIVDRKIGDKL